MTARVSIVLKSYNHASYVGEAIQSILDQSFQDFEIVVTDDGSRDGSPDIIRRFSDKRLNLLAFEKNCGISTAMNNAISRANGEFIAILNSDDFALPRQLSVKLRFWTQTPKLPKFSEFRKLLMRVDARRDPFLILRFHSRYPIYLESRCYGISFITATCYALRRP